METNLPTKADIQELVSFLPILYAEGFSPIIRWHGSKGTGGATAAWYVPVYHEKVDAFFELTAKDCWCDYNYDPKTASEMLEDEALIARAALPEIKTMLTCCRRGERFCDGYRGAVIKEGKIRLILQRLQEILRKNQ